MISFVIIQANIQIILCNEQVAIYDIGDISPALPFEEAYAR